MSQPAHNVKYTYDIYVATYDYIEHYVQAHRDKNIEIVLTRSDIESYVLWCLESLDYYRLPPVKEAMLKQHIYNMLQSMI